MGWNTCYGDGGDGYMPDERDECNHPWVDAGDTFKTYARAEASRDNPVRQAQKCPQCYAVRVVVVGYSDKRGENGG